ncbi:hypothetical protein MCBG_02121 [Micromonospora sp. M42]|nr:hypothetical protein MCBG_02121 [Micromonospora sp. M42]
MRGRVYLRRFSDPARLYRRRRRLRDPAVPLDPPFQRTGASGGVVAACRPVLAGEHDQTVMRRVVETVLAPSRLVFIDTVRAAAIGSGAAGSLLVTDVGAQLTEVALLHHRRVAARP